MRCALHAHGAPDFPAARPRWEHAVPVYVFALYRRILQARPAGASTGASSGASRRVLQARPRARPQARPQARRAEPAVADVDFLQAAINFSFILPWAQKSKASIRLASSSRGTPARDKWSASELKCMPDFLLAGLQTLQSLLHCFHTRFPTATTHAKSIARARFERAF